MIKLVLCFALALLAVSTAQAQSARIMAISDGDAQAAQQLANAVAHAEAEQRMFHYELVIRYTVADPQERAARLALLATDRNYEGCLAQNNRDRQKCAATGGGITAVTATGTIVDWSSQYDECKPFKAGWCYGFDFSDDWRFIVAKPASSIGLTAPCGAITLTR